MSSIPEEIAGVTAITKANVYFDGKVVSHNLFLHDGTKKTLGLIYPGKYHFNTDKAEGMEIVAGQCSVKVDGQSKTDRYTAGQIFELPGQSGFEIEVKSGLCEYICTFL
ncbi:MAG: pyrimidine/purine nucleoside phosphorylase [Verrucomicrobia bacterium]|nr:pyrimidine/purine nucleoside phosphorylase [Verrucomicrobiota bacterium]